MRIKVNGAFHKYSFYYFILSNVIFMVNETHLSIVKIRTVKRVRDKIIKM